MPYLLAAGNHPGSPANWVRTDDENALNSGITLPDTLMTTVTSHASSSSPFGGSLGINKVNSAFEKTKIIFQSAIKTLAVCHIIPSLTYFHKDVASYRW